MPDVRHLRRWDATDQITWCNWHPQVPTGSGWLSDSVRRWYNDRRLTNKVEEATCRNCLREFKRKGHDGTAEGRDALQHGEATR